MSIWRGIQSAIFHYLSCAPCTGAAYRKKLRKQAKRDKAKRNNLGSQDPTAYRHPDPSDTNEHWREEIILGPGPPPRRVKVKRSREGSRRDYAPSRAGTHNSKGSHGGSSVDIIHGSVTMGPDQLRTSDDTLDGENWNRKRYQREDEELWGFGEPHGLSSRNGSRPGSSIGGNNGISRPGTAYSSTGSYSAVRSPPVNELHPPVVSIPSTSVRANKWMLQPPPKAQIMNGKERAVSRSRSGSGASNKAEISLQRQVSEKKLFEKMQRGVTPEVPSWSRASSFRGPSRVHSYDISTASTNAATIPKSKTSRSVRRTRTDSSMLATEHTGSSSETMVQTPQSPTQRPTSSSGFIRISTNTPKPPIVVAEDDEATVSGTVIKRPPHESNIRRPKILQTVSSDSSDSTPLALRRRIPLLWTDQSSLNVLQERLPLRDPRNSFNPSNKSDGFATGTKASTHRFDEETDRDLDLLKHLAWAGSGFGISREWDDDVIDVRNRWSMDI